jgi:D-apionolactonase
VPTAHAVDDRSVMENALAQGITVETARSFADGRGLCVGPIELSRRTSEPDARQGSLFAAAWSIASLADICAAMPDSLTYFETAGPRGLLTLEPGPAPATVAFPVYHVFAQVAQMRGGKLLLTPSSSRCEVAAIAVSHDRTVTGMVANLGNREKRISVGPLTEPTRMRLLDAVSAVAAGSDPAGFLVSDAAMPLVGGRLELLLAPRAVAMVTGRSP